MGELGAVSYACLLEKVPARHSERFQRLRLPSLIARLVLAWFSSRIFNSLKAKGDTHPVRYAN